MTSHGRAVRHELGAPTRELRRWIPEAYEGYKQLHDAVMSPGELDAKTKELVALAVSVSRQCDGCIAAHAQGAVRNGATLGEAAEAIGVNFMMDGGPATVYGARAFAAVTEYHEREHGTSDSAQNG